MAKNKKLVPKRRFKGFAGEWEVRKLSELTSLITKGTTPLDKSNNGNINFVKIENIDSLSGEINITSHITEKEHTGYLKRSQLQENDVLFSIAGTLGRVTVVNKALLPANTNQALAIIRLKNGYLQFITTYLNGKAVADFIKKNPTIGAQPNLSLEQVANLHIAFPSEAEQTQIGTFFSHLDNLINLHQRKLEKTKALKSAYLSEMFPQEGESVPKRRFKGFTGEWEVKKLGEIAEFNPKSELPELFEYVDLESVVGTEMIAHREETKTTAPSRAQRLARQGDLFYQTVRPYQKNNYLFEKPYNNYVFSTGYAQMRPYENGYFLISLVQTDLFVKSVLDRCTGTSYPAINSNDLADMKDQIPKETEQTQIGTFFAHLDNLITHHQRKLQKLQDIKKAYLNEMFI